jgi:hypothetical protein
MSSNQWQWLIDHCRTKSVRFLPGANGEPWVPYSIVAELGQYEVSYVEKIVSKFRIRRHPIFAGLIQITSFERFENGGGDADRHV